MAPTREHDKALPPADASAPHKEPTPSKGTLAEVIGAFLRLGCISFGGPVAHLGYFHAEFVRKRRWISEQAFADLIALCQFLPGPASSQAVFALGQMRAGFAGAMAASLCFMLPSAILMVAFAYGVSSMTTVEGAGWVHGLKLAAVAVVAHALWSMWLKLCPDFPRRALAIAAAAALLLAPGAWMQVAVIAAGALAGWCIFRRVVHPPATDTHEAIGGHRAAIAALLLFGLLLVGAPLLAASTASREVSIFDAFYRSGSLVFGGGHVVLPLLRAEVVPNGWVGDDAFLAGYGAAQAVPGPLFTFAGYLGAMIETSWPRWVGGALALVAIFLPAWLLIGGALPFWHQLRARVWAQSALRGANAAVVGILAAALYAPMITDSIRGAGDVVVTVGAFALLQFARVPPWAVVALAAVAGQWVLAARLGA
ncbi:MAG: chromate efflux transporter [Phycisphaeraceae bacterium]|nr:chromate efflux transporter [Phycisphaeraceae bacterium]